jgi:hypothetical protein
MIYSHKTDAKTLHLSAAEKMKLKRLMQTKRTAWMIDKR